MVLHHRGTKREAHRGKREREGEGGEREAERKRARRESDRSGETEEASCENFQQIVPEGKFIFSLFSPVRKIELQTEFNLNLRIEKTQSFEHRNFNLMNSNLDPLWNVTESKTVDV